MTALSQRDPLVGLGRIGSGPPAIWRRTDLSLIVLAFITAAIGALTVYSTTKGSEEVAVTSFLERQVLFIMIGGLVMAVTSAIDYRKIADYYVQIFVVVIGVLFAVTRWGVERSGSQAWFEIGSFQIQPSEFAKLGLLIALAAYLAPRVGRVDLRTLGVAMLMVAMSLALIMRQPDLGTAMVTGVAAAGLLVISGVQWRQLAAVAILALAGISFVVGTGRLGDYQKARLEVYFDPSRADADAQWNAQQAKIAVASGGITGTGWGQGEQTQADWVPEQHTDFIFTAVAEELGFVGAGVVLLLYLTLSLRLVRIAQLSSDAFGTLLVAGIAATLVFQVFQNAGMSMGVMPITGIPLPLLSYGGSSTLTWFAMLGIAQSVHLRRLH